MPDELTPLPYNHKKPPATEITDKPVEVPPFTNGKKASLAEKITLPARSSVTWEAVRHFLFGMLEGGGGALAALAAAGMMASPVAWPIVGACAAAFGAVEAGRKVAKIQSGGKDWTNLLYNLLELIIKFLTMRKEVKK